MRTRSPWASLALAVAILSACSDAAPIVDRGPATIPRQVGDADTAAPSPEVTSTATAAPPVTPSVAPGDLTSSSQSDSTESTPDPSVTPGSTSVAPSTSGQLDLSVPTGPLEPGQIREDPNTLVGEYGQYNCTDASQLRYTLSQISASMSEAANQFPARVWQCEDTEATNQALECFPELTEQLLQAIAARSGDELVAQLRANNIIFCKAVNPYLNRP